MHGTIVEKLLGSPAGSFVYRDVDLLMGHDGTASLIVDRFNKTGFAPWDPEKVLIVCDHFAPPATVERANIQNHLLRFTEQHRLPLEFYTGICHQLLLEHPKVSPGSLVIGADSHTTTAGAVGALATGVGATDFMNTLASGRIWLKIPHTVRVDLKGTLTAHIQGKDVVLHLLGLLGADGALYKCLEFHDLTDNGLPMDSRAAICNMAVDLGAKFGMFVPDEITRDYLEGHGREFRNLKPALDAKYELILRINLDALEPLICTPEGAVVPVATCSDTPVSQVFMGSCTAGRLEDLASIADTLSGKQVHPTTKTIVIPGSRAVFMEAMREGHIQAISEAGAVIGNPSCGPCCNIDKGVAGDADVCLSTSNRNYPGRMGSLQSRTYLASSLTAAATALTGRITDPREVQ